ncbi:hypothetical protein DAI22_12g204100 [Oryza sativa Japonica Group]|nr:hypothetical protein DAI22_12g204100 [Oryza sativa Japonica Group]
MASRPSGGDEEFPEAKAPLLARRRASSARTLNSTADLAKHLPTGAVLAFEVLSPSSTADDSYTATNRALIACLVGAYALCCFLLSFTDSYRDGTGAVRYDFVTPSSRLRLIDGSGSPPPRDNRYRLGALSFAVFLGVAMVDCNAVACFYPLLAAVPMAAGAAGSFLFAMFPSTCRGIGFPVAAGA